MAHKTYFALRNFDYPPNHSIQLGQIISSPSEPWKKLSEPLALPESTIQRSLKTDWGTEMYRENEQRVGLWAQFAAMILGVGADAIVTWSRKNAEMFQFDELETTFFDPDQEYVQASVVGPDRENVAQWVKENRGKSVYMITGLKVARGAKHLQAHMRGVDFDFKPGVDATPFVGVPISGGPQIGAGRTKGDATWFSGSSDFVFAYRLRRIIVKRRVVSKNKDFVKGATVAFEDDDTSIGIPSKRPLDKKVVPIEDIEIESVTPSGTDYGSGGYHLDGFLSSKVRDEQDDEDCLLQIREEMA